MGLWQRLFGSPRQKLLTADGSAAVVPAVPGKLSVRVTAHTLRNGPTPVPCWTYVTDGLSSVGQKEFVLTLRRRPNEAAADAPGDPVSFFAQVYDLAATGRMVDAGDYTSFRSPAGFLGTTDPTGFMYIPPEELVGVTLPPAETALTAILLKADEAAVVPGIGTYRVTTLLGRANRYYPCPPWSDRDRPAVVTPADVGRSLLGKLPTAYLRGATVRTLMRPTAPSDRDRAVSHAGADITFRLSTALVPRLKELLSAADGDWACAFLTDADPQANVRLTWQPGQERVETITPHWSDGSCLTGGFLAVAAGGSNSDGGRLLEDGFAVTLSPGTWATVLDALRTGRPVRVPAADPDDMGLSVEWVAPPGQSGMKSSAAFDVSQLLLYQPDEVLRERIASVEAWSQYVNRLVEIACDHFTDQPPGPAQAATLVVAVKPGGQRRFWLDGRHGIDPPVVAGLLERLQEPSPPVILQGPVAVALQVKLWGGGDGGWEFIPAEWRAACGERNLLVPDGILEIVWPD